MLKKHIESFAKYAGIATVAIEWSALLSYYLRLPQYWGGKYPISYYATLDQTKLTFTISYILAGIFFWIFVRHHLTRYYNVPLKLFGLSMILFVGLALFPYHPNNIGNSIIHGILGYSSAITFLIASYMTGRNASKQIHRVSLIGAIFSIFFILAFAAAPKDSHFIFTFEALGWLIWQLWILLITYHTLRKHHTN
jgi:hypothetical protein